jgi:hypothetical protein
MPSRTHSSHYVLSIHLSRHDSDRFDGRLSNDDEYHDDSLIENSSSLSSSFSGLLFLLIASIGAHSGSVG